MTIQLHLNEKNSLTVIQVLCVIGLAVIPLFVPTDHLAWLRWQAVIVLAAAIALAAVIRQAFIQSKEDAERDKRETQRDARQEGIEAKLVEVMAVVSGKVSPTTTAHTVTMSQFSTEEGGQGGDKGEIDAEIYRVAAAGKSMAAELTRDLYKTMGREKEFAIDADVLAEIYIVNTSAGKLFIRELTGTVEIDGKVVPLLRQDNFYAWDFADMKYYYCLTSGEDRVADSNIKVLSPLLPRLPAELEPRQPLQGWVHFIVKDIDPYKLDGNRSYKFTITDSLGKEHPILKASTTPREGEVTVCPERKLVTRSS